MEGVRGASYVSDIAIDDVAILQGDECVVRNDSATNVTASDYGKFTLKYLHKFCTFSRALIKFLSI